MNALAFLDSPSMRFIVPGITAIAAVAVAVCVSFVVTQRFGRIERRLAGYEPIGAAAKPLSQNEGFDLSTDSKLGASAVDLTRDFAERTGMLGKVELFLEQADIPLRTAEFLFYAPVAVVIFSALAILTLGVVSGAVVAGLIVFVPFAFVSQKRSRRLRRFEDQLPDSLNLLAGSMRAGFSFMQGLEAIANEAAEPARKELQRVFTEARLGRNVEDAMQDSADRMSSVDMGWVVMALRIQREVGGNLAELLDTVANTMTQRERLRRELKALTAEGRFSGYVLTIMPFFFLGMFQLLQPSYVPTLFHETLGIFALIGAGVGILVGWFWLRKIVDIEV